MGFLNPLFLLAGAAVLVPVVLHLLHRRESKTFTFPAIRYLLRTERDHARRIRTRRLPLLLLRTAIVIVLVLLGARVHLPGAGGGHDPTALALVIDNSLSTTIVEDGRRRLDALKAVARLSAAGASRDDAIWVVRAGTPWEPAVPGGPDEALAAIDATEPGHARGDLVRSVERARALVGQSALPEREVHVFTDLQASAFSQPSAGPGDIPVVVFGAPAAQRANRGIAGVSFGGGLTPLAGHRTEAAVSVAGGEPGDTVGVRLHIGGRVRAAATAPAGATVRLPAGPFPPGPVEGYAEIDPDPLAADDRRYFSFTARDPTPVALLGPAPFFLAEALAVLEESGRIALGDAARAATLISMGGEGLDRRGLTQSVFVIPLADPARLPALNRRLAGAGIPHRYRPGTGEGARVSSSGLAFDLGGLAVRRHFPIVATGAPGAGGGTALATLSGGDPWIVAATAATGPYVLLASPLDRESTALPVSAAMIPFLEWAIERGSGAGTGRRSATAGQILRLPPAATAVRTPDGTRHPVDGDRPFPATSVAGLYRVLAGDSLLRTIPVNPPASESDLDPAGLSEVRRAIPGTVAIVDDASSWSRHIFRAGRGPEPWRPLAVLLLALLTVETAVAASRALRSRPAADG